MKKLCFITATRAEYGLLKWIMKDVEVCDKFCLQIIVTGAHLLLDQGHTIDTIKEDGFSISDIVDITLDSTSMESIADSMGKMAQAFSHSFAKLSPDYIIILGDRYELLPIANTAFVMRIPIIHISGGDVTEGAIDDGIRNAITMLADYHFPGTKESANNIIRMRGTDKNVWTVGEPGLDSFYRERLYSRKELGNILHLDLNKKWVLFTFHPETKESLNYNLSTVEICLDLLLSFDTFQVIATYSNTDFGGKQINDCLETVASLNPNKFILIPSLGNKKYLSLMKQVAFVIGNSSSGIVETPSLGVPTINIGNRQKGRHQCKNIYQSDASKGSLSKIINYVTQIQDKQVDNYWGDGHTSERIISILSKEL